MRIFVPQDRMPFAGAAEAGAKRQRTSDRKESDIVIFKVKARQFKLTQKELDAAPNSVLSEAAALQASSPAPIGITDWPDQDPDVFQVCSTVLAFAGPSLLQKENRPAQPPVCSLQVVVDCFKEHKLHFGKDVKAAAVHEALGYFNVPQKLWPAAAVLVAQARWQDKEAQKHLQTITGELWKMRHSRLDLPPVGAGDQDQDTLWYTAELAIVSGSNGKATFDAQSKAYMYDADLPRHAIVRLGATQGLRVVFHNSITVRVSVKR